MEDSAELRSVKTANSEYMLIVGLVTENFSVGTSLFDLTSTFPQIWMTKYLEFIVLADFH